MNHCEMMKELDRLLKLMSEADPTSKEYETIQKRYNSLFQMFLKESASCDAQVEKKQKYELERAKFEQSKERFEFEKQKFVAEGTREGRRIDLDEKKFNHQVDVDKDRAAGEAERIKIEREKLRIDEERVQNEAVEASERSRFTKRQALGRLLEIGAQGLVTMTCIVLTGKMEESAILSSKAFSFISKPKL